MSEKLVKRSDKVAFMKDGEICKRMTKFTDISTSKNPTEYTRRYVDEESDTTDVTGYAEEKAYAFDQHTENSIHEKIAKITDDELTGDDATVEVVVVDKSKESDDGFEARLRKYSVVPDSDGDSTDAYTYSGSLKAKGTFVKGVATSQDEWKTCKFTPNSSAEQ